MSEKKKKSEIAVVLICMLGIALCIYLLNTPTFLNPNDQSQALVLGEINEAYADVRLKNNKQYFSCLQQIQKPKRAAYLQFLDNRYTQNFPQCRLVKCVW